MTHWHDPKTEKPQDAELVLVYGRMKYHKCHAYALMTYFVEDDSFGEYVPYQGGINVCKWMRIPPVE